MRFQPRVKLRPCCSFGYGFPMGRPIPSSVVYSEKLYDALTATGTGASVGPNHFLFQLSAFLTFVETELLPTHGFLFGGLPRTPILMPQTKTFSVVLTPLFLILPLGHSLCARWKKTRNRSSESAMRSRAMISRCRRFRGSGSCVATAIGLPRRLQRGPQLLSPCSGQLMASPRRH